MALLSKKEVADMFGKPTNELSVMISRAVKKGSLVMTGDMIDDSNPVNKYFLEKGQAKRRIKETSMPDILGESGQEKRIDPVKNGKSALADVDFLSLDEQKTAAQIEKLDLESEKLSIQIRKWRGEVIPSDVVSPLVLQHNQSILTEGKNTIDRIFRIIKKKYDISPSDASDMTSQFTHALNQMIKDSTEMTIKSLGSLINEYAEKRGAGERA